jgi:limonene-1,2-epoxide hydrolase
MGIGQELTNRREFIAVGAASASLAVLAAKASAAEVDPKLLALEEANINLVNDFCAAWETMDVDKLASFWDDAIVYQLIEGPRINGKAALIDGTKQFLATRTEARFEVPRSAAMGNMVINERVDHFKRENNDEAFHVTGFFLVKNGKIVEWQDYTMPAGH